MMIAILITLAVAAAAGWYFIRKKGSPIESPKPPKPPKPEYVEVEVCAETFLLPNAWCPDKTLGVFEKGQEPTTICAVHREPVTPPPPPEPPFPPFSNKVILAVEVLDLHCRSAAFTDDELRAFFRKLRKRGIKYLRLFPGWLKEVVEFKQMTSGRYGLYDRNPEWDREIARLAGFAHEVGMEIQQCLMDNCSKDQPWNPFRNNQSGIQGVYDRSMRMFEIQCARVDKILELCGPDTLFELWNEAHHPGPNEEMHVWASMWGRVADYIAEQTGRRLVAYSADETVHGTASKLRAYLMAADGGTFHRDEILEILHGCVMPENVRALRAQDIWSQAVSYGISDDGAGTYAEATPPPECRGRCEEPPDIRCSADTPTRFQTALAAKNAFEGVGGGLVYASYLPKELAMHYHHINDLDEEALDIYDLLLERVF